MQIDYTLSLDLTDACFAIGTQRDEVFAIVEHDIIAPLGDSPADWVFDLEMISTAKRAIRMQQELHLDWSTTALLLSLLDERDRLRADNALLRQQLQRFLQE
ncbi:MAG: chaperone modulatory protein CbpM [Pseudomonadales bacterium]|nr:chaperone modulatory protein CbpM [Pseudomonadales bacterium]MCP5329682.1 chaperone modulatory protein CbpM [Pseudomonadales bacterium]MCP5343779.1 chaperone modulatory protein CbpM [Pseudomonadales bacterium]